MLTVTLAAARRRHACAEGYDKMAAAKGGDEQWGMDRPIPLLEVLDVCGLDDALWALRIAQPTDERDRIARLLATDYAERVLPIYEAAMPGDVRLRGAIEVARRYARGEATDAELAAAGAAARAAWAAAWAAGDAAGAAAGAAGAAAGAAGDAAGAAAWAAGQWQAARLRQYLTGEEKPCE